MIVAVSTHWKLCSDFREHLQIQRPSHILGEAALFSTQQVCYEKPLQLFLISKAMNNIWILGGLERSSWRIPTVQIRLRRTITSDAVENRIAQWPFEKQAFFRHTAAYVISNDRYCTNSLTQPPCSSPTVIRIPPRVALIPCARRAKWRIANYQTSPSLLSRLIKQPFLNYKAFRRL